MARFDDQVDPDRLLTSEERTKRAANARKAYFADLARKSAAARRCDGRRRELLEELADVTKVLAQLTDRDAPSAGADSAAGTSIQVGGAVR